MKPKHISPQVQAEHKRRHGDAPGLGRVAKIPGASTRPKIRKRSSGGKSGLRRPYHMDHRARRLSAERRFRLKIWLTLATLAVLAAFAGGMFFWLRSMGGRQASAPMFVADRQAELGQSLAIDPPSEREAQQIIERAILSSNATALHELIHITEEVSTSEMHEFFSELTERQGEIVQYQWIGTPERAQQFQRQMMNVVFEKDFLRTIRTAQLLPDVNGLWKLDFPSFARWCDPPIALMESAAGHPGGRVRAVFSRDSYYNGIFADEREWVCFSFTSPDADVSGYAYARIDSPVHEMMTSLLGRNRSAQSSPPAQSSPTRLTVEIARVEGANPRQFELTRVVSGHWLASEFADTEERR